jgi:hypothetical protein
VSADAEKPVVSIVATFHNIKPALIRRCVDSLVAQRFSKSYELILVDDCSTDDTLTILRSYQGYDFVTLLELSTNVGAGGARNAGIRAARAKYVTFVDGDDFVSPYYLGLLVGTQAATSAQFVVSKCVIIPYNRVNKERDWKRDADVVVMDRSQYLEALCYEEVTESPWGKLAPRELYLQHPFPEGMSYEDVAIAAEHALCCERFAFVPTVVYGYVMRPESVVHKSVAPFKQATDFRNAITAMLNPIARTMGDDALPLCYRRCLELARLHSLLKVTDGKPSEVSAMDRKAIDQIRASLPAIAKDPKAPLRNVARFRILAKSPAMYDKLFGAFEAIKKGVER